MLVNARKTDRHGRCTGRVVFLVDARLHSISTMQDGALNAAAFINNKYPVTKIVGDYARSKHIDYDALANPAFDASKLKIKSQGGFPWQHDSDGSLFTSDSEKLKAKINFLRKQLDLAPIEISRQWRDEAGVLNKTKLPGFVSADFSEKVMVSPKIDIATRNAICTELVRLETDLSVQEQEQAFRRAFKRWLRGEAPIEQYASCTWLSDVEKTRSKPNSPDTINNDFRRSLISRVPGIADGILFDEDIVRPLQEQALLAKLAQLIPRNQEESLLFFKYIVMKLPVEAALSIDPRSPDVKDEDKPEVRQPVVTGENNNNDEAGDEEEAGDEDEEEEEQDEEEERDDEVENDTADAITYNNGEDIVDKYVADVQNAMNGMQPFDADLEALNMSSAKIEAERGRLGKMDIGFAKAGIHTDYTRKQMQKVEQKMNQMQNLLKTQGDYISKERGRRDALERALNKELDEAKNAAARAVALVTEFQNKPQAPAQAAPVDTAAVDTVIQTALEEERTKMQRENERMQAAYTLNAQQAQNRVDQLEQSLKMALALSQKRSNEIGLEKDAKHNLEKEVEQNRKEIQQLKDKTNKTVEDAARLQQLVIEQKATHESNMRARQAELETERDERKKDEKRLMAELTTARNIANHLQHIVDVQNDPNATEQQKKEAAVALPNAQATGWLWRAAGAVGSAAVHALRQANNPIVPRSQLDSNSNEVRTADSQAFSSVSNATTQVVAANVFATKDGAENPHIAAMRARLKSDEAFENLHGSLAQLHPDAAKVMLEEGPQFDNADLSQKEVATAYKKHVIIKLMHKVLASQGIDHNAHIVRSGSDDDKHIKELEEIMKAENIGIAWKEFDDLLDPKARQVPNILKAQSERARPANPNNNDDDDDDDDNAGDDEEDNTVHTVHVVNKELVQQIKTSLKRNNVTPDQINSLAEIDETLRTQIIIKFNQNHTANASAMLTSALNSKPMNAALNKQQTVNYFVFCFFLCVFLLTDSKTLSSLGKPGTDTDENENVGRQASGGAETSNLGQTAIKKGEQIVKGAGRMTAKSIKASLMAVGMFSMRDPAYNTVTHVADNLNSTPTNVATTYQTALHAGFIAHTALDYGSDWIPGSRTLLRLADTDAAWVAHEVYKAGVATNAAKAIVSKLVENTENALTYGIEKIENKASTILYTAKDFVTGYTPPDTHEKDPILEHGRKHRYHAIAIEQVHSEGNTQFAPLKFVEALKKFHTSPLYSDEHATEYEIELDKYIARTDPYVEYSLLPDFDPLGAINKVVDAVATQVDNAVERALPGDSYVKSGLSLMSTAAHGAATVQNAIKDATTSYTKEYGPELDAQEVYAGEMLARLSDEQLTEFLGRIVDQPRENASSNTIPMEQRVRIAKKMVQTSLRSPNRANRKWLKAVYYVGLEKYWATRSGFFSMIF